MFEVKFRPHTISLLDVVDGSYCDETGDYIQGREVWSDGIPCRYEPNGRARTVPVGMDKDYVYEYTVFLNADCPDIRYGQKCKLYDQNGDCMGEYTAHGFHRGQLDAKLWI